MDYDKIMNVIIKNIEAIFNFIRSFRRKICVINYGNVIIRNIIQ